MNREFKCVLCEWRRPASRVIACADCFICFECVEMCAQIVIDHTSDEDHRTDRAVDRLVEASELRAEVARMRTAGASLRLAMTSIEDAAKTLGLPAQSRCRWCGEAFGDDVVQGHVATCEKHPAVILLREYQEQEAVRRG